MAVKETAMIESAPMVEWADFVDGFTWRQGEHVGMIGPTGAGKTNLAFWLLPLHKYIVIFATKPKDVSMDAFGKRNGFRKLAKWVAMNPVRNPRRLIWPDARKMDSEEVQQKVFHDAFQRIFREGGWTLYLDELYYMVAILGFGKIVKQYLLQARSLGISLVVATQRPAWIPLEVYDQSTHLFFWRDNDETNLRRISGISWRSSDEIRKIVSELPLYHVLYINTRTGDMMVTRPPAPKRIQKGAKE